MVRDVRALLPHEDILYFADSAYCPYGIRAPEEIRERSLAITAELVRRGIKLLVVACNTACSVALTDLRAHFTLPIIGLEPAVKPAAHLTRTGRIAVLATPRTVAGHRLANLIRDHAGNAEVYSIPAPGLVELVEAGQTSGPTVEHILHPLLDPLVAIDVDTVVLGCTHYPFLRTTIEHLTGPEIRVIDSGAAIARRTRDVLARDQLARSDSARGEFHLLTTGDVDHVGTVSSRLLGAPVTASRTPI